LYVQFKTSNSGESVIFPAMRTQGEKCRNSNGSSFCLRWDWRPKEVCFTVFGRAPAQASQKGYYGCQTLVGSILEQ
jgi:hypothetical protein